MLKLALNTILLCSLFFGIDANVRGGRQTPTKVRKRQLDQGATGITDNFKYSPESSMTFTNFTGVSIGSCVLEKSLCKYLQLIRFLSLSLCLIKLFSKIQIANFEPKDNIAIKGETFTLGTSIYQTDGISNGGVSLLLLLHAL